MDWTDLVFAWLDLVMREAALFAAIGFLILGAGDLFIDLVWLARAAALRLGLGPRLGPARASDLPRPQSPGPIAIFVPAWQEDGVIAHMLRAALSAIDHADYRIFVGCYPNDAATIEAVRAVDDPRVRLVVGPSPGPTTKADCLNHLWERMEEEEVAAGRRFKAVVLHDAEDVVHSAELRIFDHLIERFDLVQLPVLPLIDKNSPWVGGHYADEFAESHGKDLVVREALGAALPSAGVGCAFSRGALARLAEANGAPFDADSLTEDYELGLKLKALGGRAAFVRVHSAEGARRIVATREYFPPTLRAAISQKARWITGIALSGWDRLGWSGGLAERWIRLRDRLSLLAALILFSGYLAFALWLLGTAYHALSDTEAPPLPAFLGLLLTINLGLLAWRLAMRFDFVAAHYGWREGLRSIPRVVVGNVISILAAWVALTRYLTMRRTGRPHWAKTVHAFPAQLPAE